MFPFGPICIPTPTLPFPTTDFPCPTKYHPHTFPTFPSPDTYPFPLPDCVPSPHTTHHNTICTHSNTFCDLQFCHLRFLRFAIFAHCCWFCSFCFAFMRAHWYRARTLAFVLTRSYCCAWDIKISSQISARSFILINRKYQ